MIRLFYIENKEDKDPYWLVAREDNSNKIFFDEECDIPGWEIQWYDADPFLPDPNELVLMYE